MGLTRDLSEQRFSRLVVVKFAGHRTGKSFWLCHCDCGNKAEIRSDQLTLGVAKSCGCLQRDIARKLGHRKLSKKSADLRLVRIRRAAKGLPSNLGIRDLTGRRFNRLKVIGFTETRNQRSYWHCQCDCGNSTVVAGSKLTYGSTTSCGCRQCETGVENSVRHGRHNTPEYYTWAAMKQRCLNPNYHHYQNYGGRGISICQRWLDSFEAFFTDMGPKPSPHHSLDRRKNNGNYTKANCRWATAKEQAGNRRSLSG